TRSRVDVTTRRRRSDTAGQPAVRPGARDTRAADFAPRERIGYVTRARGCFSPIIPLWRRYTAPEGRRHSSDGPLSRRSACPPAAGGGCESGGGGGVQAEAVNGEGAADAGPGRPMLTANLPKIGPVCDLREIVLTYSGRSPGEPSLRRRLGESPHYVWRISHESPNPRFRGRSTALARRFCLGCAHIYRGHAHVRLHSPGLPGPHACLFWATRM